AAAHWPTVPVRSVGYGTRHQRVARAVVAEVRMSLGEVAEDDRHAQDAFAVQHFAGRVSGAGEPLLDGAVRRAPVTVDHVAVVAVLEIGRASCRERSESQG